MIILLFILSKSLLLLVHKRPGLAGSASLSLSLSLSILLLLSLLSPRPKRNSCGRLRAGGLSDGHCALPAARHTFRARRVIAFFVSHCLRPKEKIHRTLNVPIS